MAAALTRPSPFWRLAFVTTLLLAAVSSRPALAIYPERIVRIVVPFAPGGGTDVVARTLAHDMEGDLGKSVMIENKPGAGTIVGTQAVATSRPDGYTLLMGTFANAVNPSLNAKLPYDPHKDFVPVALIARSFNIVVVNPKSPVRTIADLIAAAKANPGKLTFGTFGAGTSAHLAGELFKNMARVNLTAVPYKGAAPGITDLIGGQIDVMFTTVANAASLVKKRPVARDRGHFGPRRSPAFPQLPTVAEAGVPGMPPKAATACLRRPARPTTSSTGSTNRRPWRCSPKPSKSSASTRAWSWSCSRRRRSTDIFTMRKNAGAA